TPTLAQSANAVAATGEDLMRIGLVADVPYQPVAWRIENPVQGDSELHDTEPGTQMASRHRHDINGLLPQLIYQLAEILLGNAAQVCRRFHPVKKRRLGGLIHTHILTSATISG